MASRGIILTKGIIIIAHIIKINVTNVCTVFILHKDVYFSSQKFHELNANKIFPMDYFITICDQTTW